jgi:phospholipase C
MGIVLGLSGVNYAWANPSKVARTVSVPNEAPTTTPIKYVVVIFQENNSFDHYFGTYPN